MMPWGSTEDVSSKPLDEYRAKPPALLSFSSLTEIEECPRRWSLTRSKYPALWARNGYPTRPYAATLAGTAIHKSLDALIRSAHVADGAEDPDAVTEAKIAALVDAGGYRALIESFLKEEIAQLVGNPRASLHRPVLERTLESQLPKLRGSLQTLYTRAPIQRSAPETHAAEATAPSVRAALPEGPHTEVELRSDDLHLFGYADLIEVSRDTAAITDFKTGDEGTMHGEQLRMYAALWSDDRERNPQQLPVNRLTLSYPSGDVDVPLAPTDDSPDSDWANRVTKARASVSVEVPEARPGAKACINCQVKHMCDEFWASDYSETTDFIDGEVIVRRRLGTRSFEIDWTKPAIPKPATTLLTHSENIDLTTGRRYRIVGARRIENESSAPTMSTNAWTEYFWISEPVDT